MPDCMISIEEFKNIDIRIGKVLEVKDHELAKKPMYILKDRLRRGDRGEDDNRRHKDRYQKDEILGRRSHAS